MIASVPVPGTPFSRMNVKNKGLCWLSAAIDDKRPGKRSSHISAKKNV